MKKIATATIATAGIATFGMLQHDADAAEKGYNPNDPTSFSYSYTIDQNGEYHFTWKGNWNPSMFNHGSYQSYNNYNATAQNTNATAGNTQTSNYSAPAQTQAPSYNNNVRTASAPTTNVAAASTTQSLNVRTMASRSGSSANLYTAGQCTYYVFDKVGGKIGSTWGNASNWASAASSAGYTVNNSPAAGSIMQTGQGPMGHVAYVERVNNDGSVVVSEMNYGYGPGVVTSRTISAGQAGSYNYIH